MFSWIESLSELGRYLSTVYIDCDAGKVAWRFLMSCPIQWRGKQTT